MTLTKAILCDLDGTLCDHRHRLLSVVEFPNYAVNSEGHIYGKTRKGNLKKLNPYTNRKGYFWIQLYKDGKRHRRGIHRLVCGAFNGACPDGFECSHLNGNPLDNRPENLIWESHHENIKRAHANGKFTGSKHHNAKFTPEQVCQIRDMISKGIKQKDIAKAFGVHRMTIQWLNKKRSYPNE